MHKLTVLYPEPIDRVAFTDYYLRIHLPLCAQLPGVQEITYSIGMSEPDEGPYFGIFQASFADEQALMVALSSPEGRAVEADVANYATGGAIVFPFQEETVPLG